MNSIIEVREVSKVFGVGPGAVQALHPVTTCVNGGELVLLAGPSGSGKTTLLSIMGGIMRPSSGRCWIGAREITGLSERELPRVRLENIGFIFQGFNLFSTLTVVENVELALELKGVRGRKARGQAERLLELVGLADRPGMFPATLSGGQKQRVAIARALAGEPRAILADEPTAALDWENGRTVMDLLYELAHRDERAVVVVSHDLRAEEYADRVVRLIDGRIVPRQPACPPKALGDKIRKLQRQAARKSVGPSGSLGRLHAVEGGHARA